jgi:regulator of protease activity HflC (stomatin/prohibitin superfamily)
MSGLPKLKPAGIVRGVLLIVVAGAAITLFSLTACGQVQPGHVGIRVNQFGSGAGVDDRSLGVGTYFKPFGTTIYEYPVFTNTYTYTRSATEGQTANEEFNFQDKNGLGLSADIAVSYSVNAQLAPRLFQKYRTDAAGIIAGPLRNAIRNALVNRGASMGVEEIYGPRKQELLTQVQNDVANYFAPYGLVVEKLFWAGNVRVPDVVLAQINNKIANEQHALAAQAQVATVEAEARQRVASADGEAKAITLQGAALRANPEVLRLRAIEKWDGRLPQVTSGGTPLIDLNR